MQIELSKIETRLITSVNSSDEEFNNLKTTEDEITKLNEEEYLSNIQVYNFLIPI